MKRLKDLREYLDELKAHDDVRHIDDQVDPHLEAGAAARYSYENRGPALLLNHLTGHDRFCRILAAPAGLSSIPEYPLARIALSLGLDVAATAREIIDALAASRTREPIPPVVVDHAPCQDNVLLGEEADLDRFPAPMLHDGDGGPYINTWGTIIVSTPDGSFTNWAIARVMKIDGRRMTGTFIPTQHLGQIRKQWSDLGRPMPFAIVQGTEPGIPFIASMPLPDGVEEAAFLGTHFGEPMELVKCTTLDLLVPASAEIVIEGHVMPGRTAVEGPMGEYAGYQPRHTSMQPEYVVEAITYRDEPIWPISVAGEPADETHTAWGLVTAAEALAQLRAANLPVSTAWMPFESASHWLVITLPGDWREQLPGVGTDEMCLRISQVLSNTRIEAIFTRIFVLDDDIDPSNPTELAWAIATRVSPARGRIIRHGMINPLAGCYSDQERRLGYGPKAVLNGLQAPSGERNTRSSFRHSYPEAVQQRVIELLAQ
ncbi:UbiD family decarboxylase [Streptomyces sp. RPT161]|uniref:UbiD family decarboxylase n=1 Tax=Streptomyces sp. RPT161 TaxID=3015993 RepID=UPI0022B90EDC|nr:UbiD family decarboxylase [Streptomyces sp. RPT161]